MRFLVAFALFAMLSGRASADELETIEGVKLSGTIQSISTAGDVSGPGIDAGTRLDALRTILRPVKPVESPAPFLLETHGDGRLRVSAVALADDRFQVTLVDGIELSLPLDAIRCLRLEPTLTMTAFQEALARPSAEQDKIFVKVDKQIDAVSGLIVGLNEKELTFEYEGAERKLPRERIHGVVLARSSEPKSPPASVQLVNGSRVAGKILSLQGGNLELELLGGAKVAFPVDSIERIDLRSPRLVYLSDLEPYSVNEETLLTLPKPWQRNRSVEGKTLTLAGVTYARGIGVHSKSELAFDVPSGFDVFVATVGIDAETQGKGDCEFEVLGDDRRLFFQRIKGSEPPQAVRVDLRNVKRITLRALPGADFDLGDHADWCDARFLKTK